MNMVDEHKQELLTGDQDLREEIAFNEYASLHQRSGVVCGFDPRANKACYGNKVDDLGHDGLDGVEKGVVHPSPQQGQAHAQ